MVPQHSLVFTLFFFFRRGSLVDSCAFFVTVFVVNPSDVHANGFCWMQPVFSPHRPYFELAGWEVSSSSGLQRPAEGGNQLRTAPVVLEGPRTKFVSYTLRTW